jgi:hypothetical protein
MCSVSQQWVLKLKVNQAIGRIKNSANLVKSKIVKKTDYQLISGQNRIDNAGNGVKP